MSPRINSFKNNVLAGILFLLPICAILVLAGKVFLALFSIGQALTQKLGLHSILGATGASVLVVVLLVVLCYLAGFLVRFSFFAHWRNKLDDLLAFWLPPYRIYREMALKKLAGQKELLPYQSACWLKADGDCLQPAFVMEKYADGRYLVFIPTAGNVGEGSLLVCPPESVLVAENDSLKAFHNSYDAMGIGMPAPPPIQA
jgi:uncharacterized membrane protein